MGTVEKPSSTAPAPLLQRRQTTRETYNNSVGPQDGTSLSDANRSFTGRATEVSRKTSTVSAQDKDPLTVKDKLF